MGPLLPEPHCCALLLATDVEDEVQIASLASQTHIKMFGLGTVRWHGSVQGVG